MYEKCELNEKLSVETSSEYSYDAFDAEKDDKAMFQRKTRYITDPTNMRTVYKYILGPQW